MTKPHCQDCRAFVSRPGVGVRLKGDPPPWGECTAGHGYDPEQDAACQHLRGMVSYLGVPCDDFNEGQVSPVLPCQGASREVVDGMAGVIERAKSHDPTS